MRRKCNHADGAERDEIAQQLFPVLTSHKPFADGHPDRADQQCADSLEPQGHDALTVSATNAAQRGLPGV